MNLLKAKETCGDNSPQVFKPKNKKTISGGNVFYASIVALPLLQFIVFYVVVNFNSFLMAFQSYDNSTGKAVIGFTFDNFAYFFDKIVFNDLWLCIKNSLLYLALNIVICIPVSLLFSYYIYKKFLLSELFKVILFLPSIVCSTAMVIFYKYFVNQGLASLLGGSVIGPVYNEKQQGVLVAFYLLMTFSANILLYINAMSQTPDSVVEASKIDGANEIKTFIHVIIPQIWGTIVSIIVIFLAWFATNQAYLFTFYGFNANRQYQTIGYYLFNMVQDGRFTGSSLEQMYRKASALGLMFTAIVAPLTILIRKLMLRYGPNEN